MKIKKTPPASKIKMFEAMIDARNRDDAVEPVGHFYRSKEGGAGAQKWIAEYIEDDLEAERGPGLELIYDKKYVWHGHPNGDFAYDNDHPILSKIEDGNPNKPSVPDLVQALIYPFSEYLIAVPEGIITLRKEHTVLNHQLATWFNQVGITSPNVLPGLSSATLFLLMQNANIERYNKDTWMELCHTLGFSPEWRSLDSLHRPESKTGPIDERPYQYYVSSQFSSDLRQAVRLL